MVVAGCRCAHSRGTLVAALGLKKTRIAIDFRLRLFILDSLELM